ncbi:MAG: sulfotransferase domain-containing protein [Phenylobacterium sp.]|uniref:sulfotransferase domain-containing protein n=1 Tax=Phenylobacterium sp. TaxID=1871053 RepID=UPI003919D109
MGLLEFGTAPAAEARVRPARREHRAQARRLAGRDLGNDLSNFHLLKYAGRVDGYFVTAKNSGTHWLRFMLSAAIAHRLNLPAPSRSSGRDSETFICHPKRPQVFSHAPRIGASHNIPSRLVAALARAGLVRLPPTVVLVRDIPEALVSYYVKWREPYGLGELSAFVRRPAPGAKKVEDVWWFVRFFNRWGGLARACKDQILVVRYEDVQNDPAGWVRRIWSHWGVELDAADAAAALDVSSREALAERLDPGYGEPIVPDRALRAAVRLSAADEAVLEEVFSSHLLFRLGYEHRPVRRRRSVWGARGPRPARTGWRLLWGMVFFAAALGVVGRLQVWRALG